MPIDAQEDRRIAVNAFGSQLSVFSVSLAEVSPRSGNEPNEHRNQPDDDGGEDPGGDTIDLQTATEEVGDEEREERRDESRERDDGVRMLSQRFRHDTGEHRRENRENDQRNDEAAEVDVKAGKKDPANDEGDRRRAEAQYPRH